MDLRWTTSTRQLRFIACERTYQNNQTRMEVVESDLRSASYWRDPEVRPTDSLKIDIAMMRSGVDEVRPIDTIHQC